MMLGGDDESYWRYSLVMPGRAAVEETTNKAPTYEIAIDMFNRLWERQAPPTEPPPTGIEEAIELWLAINGF